MSKGGTPPVAPDPMATAQAQATVNKDAAITQAELDRINQVGPNGSISYEITGQNPSGTPQYTQTTTLSPELNTVNQGLNSAAALATGNVVDALGKPFNLDGVPAMTTNVVSNAGDLQRLSGTAAPVQSTYDSGGSIGRLADGVGGVIQKSLDTSGLPALPGIGDFSADAKRMSDSVYGQYTSRLDPAYQQNESDIRSRLAAQGISENSDAYRRELDNFGRTKNDAYGQAAYQATQAGSVEQSRLFGLASDARQQLMDEIGRTGDFANSAQAQGFGQAATTASVNNAAQAAQNQQAHDAAVLANQTADQQFQQELAAKGFNNTAAQQAVNTNLAVGAFNNNARQQSVEEQAYLRSLPVNEIATLTGTSGGVSAPQFNPVPQVGVAAPDYQGLVSNNYNQQVAQYNQQQANRSSGLGSIFGALGSVGGAIAMSDMRTKYAIRRVGTLANGIRTYSFKYIGSRLPQFGAMAQQVFKVRPQAVILDRSGLMKVDYAKVYA